MADDNKFGIASLVLGIASIVFCWIPILGIVAGILAIVFYSKQKKIKKSDMAIGGLVTGIIGLAASVVYNVLWLLSAVLLAGTVAAFA